jgi:hypothetical protein
MFIATALTLLVLSRNNINHTTIRPFYKASLQDQLKKTSYQQNREKLIQELKNLEVAFNHKDKIALSKYFKFPLGDSQISTYGIDRGFDNERKKNGDQITEKMFQKHFVRLYEYFQMEEFSKLFRNLNLADLLKKDQLSCEKHYKNSGCFYMYDIIIDTKEITLFYGNNSDDSYMKTHPDEQVVCAEHSYHWTFIFDGKKLYFKNLIEAG